MTNPGGAGNSVSIAATGHDETFCPAAFADNESAIRREGWPAFGDGFHFGGPGGREKRFEFFGEIMEDRQVWSDCWRCLGKFVGTRIGMEGFGFPTAEE